MKTFDYMEEKKKYRWVYKTIRMALIPYKIKL